MLKKVILLILLGSMLSLSGCLMLLRSEMDEAPDLSKVHVGATRSQVESVLKDPISEHRAHVKSGADKKCTYHYFVTEKTLGSPEETFTDKISDLERKEVLVFYGYNGRVIRIEHVNKNRARFRY